MAIKYKLTDNWTRIDSVKSSTDVFDNGDTVDIFHHNHETKETTWTTAYKEENPFGKIENIGSLLWGWILIFPLVCAVLSLISLRNSTYTIMATPIIVYQLATGQGFGWVSLVICVAPAILWAIIAHNTEKAGVILSFVWSLLVGIGLILYHALILKDPHYWEIVDYGWIDLASTYISTVIHVFFFMMTIQMFTMLLSFNLTHIAVYWIAMPVLFVLLNFLSFAFFAVGSKYPTNAYRYYSMIEPICRVFGLTEECIEPHLEWVSHISKDMPLICLLICAGLLVFGSIIFVIVCEISFQRKRRRNR